MQHYQKYQVRMEAVTEQGLEGLRKMHHHMKVKNNYKEITE